MDYATWAEVGTVWFELWERDRDVFFIDGVLSWPGVIARSCHEEINAGGSEEEVADRVARRLSRYVVAKVEKLLPDCEARHAA